MKFSDLELLDSRNDLLGLATVFKDGIWFDDKELTARYSSLFRKNKIENLGNKA